MAVPAELVGLIHQIRNAASAVERIKLAALAWRTLRGLSPADRLAVAREIGVEGAERLVDQLGSRTGLSPARLLGAIRRAEEADPEELHRMLGELRTGEGREALLEEAAGRVEGWLEAEIAEGFPAEDAQERHVDADAELVEVVDAPVVPASPPPESPAVPVVSSPPRAATVPAPPPTADVVVAPVVSELVPACHRQTAHFAHSEGRPAAAARRDERTAGRSSRKPERHDSRPTAPVGEEIAAEGSTFAGLRKLAERRADLAALGQGEAAAIAAFFPPGWARRRAVEALIDAGVVSTPGQLLALLGPEDSSSNRMWLLSSLARRGVNLDELESAVGADDRPAMRRRLGLRAARARD